MRRKIIITSILGIAMILGVTTKVEANLQSKPGATPSTGFSMGNFFIKTRNMEAAGESFGLQATINQSNGTETTSSNGIDVHMMKNTEYGAIAMLGASAYGLIPAAVSAQTNANTMSGNKTGVHMNVSGNTTTTATSVISTLAGIPALQRYWNKYVGTTYKKGDATTETRLWKNAGKGDWIENRDLGFLRGRPGVFSYGTSYGDSVGGNLARSSCVCCGFFWDLGRVL